MARRSGIMSVLGAVCALGCVALGSADAQAGQGEVTVEIVDSHGTVFQQVPVKRAVNWPGSAEASTRRAFLEAERDARYRIRITNPTGRRVGVVVAVDGRNIISGAKSGLEQGEPMYILDSGSTQEFSGWRANLSEVNEFYFTQWKDSYAEAFGDRSARGVIAVAVYREKAPPRRLWSEEPRTWREESRRRGEAEAPAADASAPANAPREAQAAKKAERSDAGTGYGDRRSEYATQVSSAPSRE
jgi:hypothetical protein